MKKYILAVICILGITGLFVIVNATNSNSKSDEKKESKTYYVEAGDVITFSSMEELIGYSDYVFIGKVNKITKGNYDKDKDLMPYTIYNMSVEHNYKGNLKEDITISKYGGYDKSGDLQLLKNNNNVEEMLEKDNKYLIFANAQDDKELLIISVGGTYNIEAIKSYDSDISIYQYSKNNKISVNMKEKVKTQKEYKRDRQVSKYEIKK